MSDAPTATGLHLHDVLASGQVLAGRFRVERLLGMGGMGMVYLANDLTLEVPVAIKVLRPELAERPQVFERFRRSCCWRARSPARTWCASTTWPNTRAAG